MFCRLLQLEDSQKVASTDEPTTANSLLGHPLGLPLKDRASPRTLRTTLPVMNGQSIARRMHGSATVPPLVHPTPTLLQRAHNITPTLLRTYISERTSTASRNPVGGHTTAGQIQQTMPRSQSPTRTA